MTALALEPKDMQWLEKGVLGIEWTDPAADHHVDDRRVRRHASVAVVHVEGDGDLAGRQSRGVEDWSWTDFVALRCVAARLAECAVAVQVPQ